MDWKLEEALERYETMGAPADQNALIALLKEIQRESGGSLPRPLVTQAAERYGVREALLLALIRRIPSLRLADTHCLELCGGPACARRARLEAFVRRTYGAKPAGFTVKTVGCMHQCGKGPNLRWDGVLYTGADEALIRRLAEGSRPR